MATDTGSLLGQLLGAALNSGSVRGAGAGAGASQSGLPGGLGDILGQVLAGAGQQGGAAGGGAAGGLGDILGQVLAGAGQQGGAAGGGAGGLGDLLGQVLGGAAGGQGASPAGGAGAGGLGGLLGQMLGGATAGGAASSGGLGGMIGDALGGAVGGTTSAPVPVPQTTPSADGTEPSGMGDLVKYGGMAVIGMLAFNAFRKWQSEAGAPSADLTQAAQNFSPAQAPGGAEAFSQVLVKAMAAAAQADGKLDQDELNRITQGLTKMGADSPSQLALIQALSTPVNPQELINAATSPEAAMQIYAASVLAIRPDSAAEQRYLTNLAQQLGVDPQLKAQIDKDLVS